MKTWQIISLSIALLSLIVGVLILLKKKNVNLLNNNVGGVDLQTTFLDLEKVFGFAIAQNVEKIYRLESANFSSNIYNNTNGAGMLSFANSFPYGWNSLNGYWLACPDCKPIGIYQSTNGYSYLKFNGNGGFYTLAEFLRQHSNNAGRWYSLVESEQEYYNSLIDNINTSFC